MCTRIFLWVTRWGNALSHREQSNGLCPVWILWQVFRWMDKEKFLSHQKYFAENKVPFCFIGQLVGFWKTQRRKICFNQKFNWDLGQSVVQVGLIRNHQNQTYHSVCIYPINCPVISKFNNYFCNWSTTLFLFSLLTQIQQ